MISDRERNSQVRVFKTQRFIGLISGIPETLPLRAGCILKAP